jgi:hypothetical protein
MINGIKTIAADVGNRSYFIGVHQAGLNICNGRLI